MIDIRPCLQTYARVAHVRWLKGDLDGAIELMEQAVKAGSTREPEPAAWVVHTPGRVSVASLAT